MQTKLSDQFGVDVPVYAFSHCRDVVAAVTNAGGMGVLGAAWMTAEELDMSLRWINERVDGKPYGVDLVFPGSAQDNDSAEAYVDNLPKSHFDFVDQVFREAGVAELPKDNVRDHMVEYAKKMAMTPRKSDEQLEVALSHATSFIVGALGVTPKKIVEAVHARGKQVGALVGSAHHALKQKEAGVDVVVAQGTEAGGSVGSIASMVLWPQVVEAVGSLPVLAAGGIGHGSQILAALALGCSGVWTGSIWLGTTESELNQDMKQALFDAKSEDAVISRVMTGKQGRMLRSKYTEAWSAPEAPELLQWPLQSIFGGYPFRRAERARRMDYWTYSVGQIVGDMHNEQSVRQVMEQLLTEYVDALERLQGVTG